MQKVEKYIQVEYDEDYWGGDYDDVGKFVLIPLSECHARSNCVEKAFVAITGLDCRHIVHYCIDEMYDKDGNSISS